MTRVCFDGSAQQLLENADPARLRVGDGRDILGCMVLPKFPKPASRSVSGQAYAGGSAGCRNRRCRTLEHLRYRCSASVEFAGHPDSRKTSLSSLGRSDAGI